MPASSNNQNSTIRLVNILGQTVLENELTTLDNTVNIETLSDGIYLYVIEVNGVSIKSGRINKN